MRMNIEDIEMALCLLLSTCKRKVVSSDPALDEKIFRPLAHDVPCFECKVYMVVLGDGQRHQECMGDPSTQDCTNSC